MMQNYQVVMHPQIDLSLEKNSENFLTFYYGSNLDMNEISVESVIMSLQKLLDAANQNWSNYEEQYS